MGADAACSGSCVDQEPLAVGGHVVGVTNPGRACVSKQRLHGADLKARRLCRSLPPPSACCRERDRKSQFRRAAIGDNVPPAVEICHFPPGPGKGAT